MAMPCIFLQLQCDEASLSSFPPSQFQGELYNEFSNPWPSPNMKIEDTFEITKTGLHCALHRQETRIRSSTAWLSSWWSAPLVYRASDAYFHVCEYLFTPDHQQGSTTWRINLPPLWQPPLFCFHSNWPMLLRWLLIDFQFMFLNSFPRKPFLNCGPTIWSTTPPTHALTWYDHWPMYGPLCWLFYLTERSFPRLIQVPIVKRVAAAVVKQTEAGSMTPAVARWVC